MIESGRLRPGDRLPSERALSEQFDVSRNTVREALRMLEISGLITLRRGASGGAFIAEADPSLVARSMSDMIRLTRFTLAELTEARIWIQEVVVRQACARIDDEGVASLEENISQVEDLLRAGKYDEAGVRNTDFHVILAEGTQNPIMIAMMQALMEIMKPLVLAMGPRTDDLILRSRRRFMTFLTARDADGAVKAMNEHLTTLYRDWVEGDYAGARRALAGDRVETLLPERG